MNATAEQITNFTALVTTWDIKKLVTYYAQQFAASSFGSNDLELNILMAEITSRTN